MEALNDLSWRRSPPHACHGAVGQRLADALLADLTLELTGEGLGLLAGVDASTRARPKPELGHPPDDEFTLLDGCWAAAAQIEHDRDEDERTQTHGRIVASSCVHAAKTVCCLDARPQVQAGCMLECGQLPTGPVAASALPPRTEEFPQSRRAAWRMAGGAADAQRATQRRGGAPLSNRRVSIVRVWSPARRQPGRRARCTCPLDLKRGSEHELTLARQGSRPA
jgi:hypothetical protein